MKAVPSISLAALLFNVIPFNDSAWAQPVEVAPGVVQLGNLQNPNLTESSGAASSRRLRGTFWTHNDEGPAILYSFSTDGTPMGEWDVDGLDTHDWEDLAWSSGRLYIADIGNNHGQPGDVYLVSEPNPRKSGTLRVIRQWKLTYPDGVFDSEAFFVSRGSGYIIEKESGKAHLYRFKLAGRTMGQLEEQCTINTDSEVTGADITRDNRRLAVITDFGAYLFVLPKQIPSKGTLEPLFFVPYELNGMEGCTFTRDGLLVTAESGEILLFTDPLFTAK